MRILLLLVSLVCFAGSYCKGAGVGATVSFVKQLPQPAKDFVQQEDLLKVEGCNSLASVYNRWEFSGRTVNFTSSPIRPETFLVRINLSLHRQGHLQAFLFQIYPSHNFW
jgi:hypothetical protein